MSFYLEILSRQRPFQAYVDNNDRVVYSMNFDAFARAGVDKLEEEVARVLYDAGLSTLGSTGNTNLGLAGTVPSDNAGPYITIIETSGRAPDITHDGLRYERLTFQILVRAKNRQAARTRALAVWRALDGQRNVVITAA